MSRLGPGIQRQLIAGSGGGGGETEPRVPQGCWRSVPLRTVSVFREEVCKSEQGRAGVVLGRSRPPLHPDPSLRAGLSGNAGDSQPRTGWAARPRPPLSGNRSQAAFRSRKRPHIPERQPRTKTTAQLHREFQGPGGTPILGDGSSTGGHSTQRGCPSHTQRPQRPSPHRRLPECSAH